MQKLTIFVSHHPGDLLLYKNFVMIRRALDNVSPIILIKVNHPYYRAFDITPYRNLFDAIIELPFIAYRRNIVKGIAEIHTFNKQYKKIGGLMDEKAVTVFVGQSAWLPVNALLFRFAKEKNIANLYRWGIDMRQSIGKETQADTLRTLYCRIYRLLIPSYIIKAIATRKGKFADFAYENPRLLPGKMLTILNPAQKKISLEQKNGTILLPYPLVKEGCESKNQKKDMVIIFGDADILKDFKEYLDDYEEGKQKMENFFAVLQRKYENCALYYKPHPADTDKVMPGINQKDYIFFSNATNAQGIIDAYHSRIRAAYTFSSSSIFWSSFFGIPSYTFYRLLYNDRGVKRYDELFENPLKANEYIWNISAIEEIGKIDDVKQTLHYLDLAHLDKTYKKIFS